MAQVYRGIHIRVGKLHICFRFRTIFFYAIMILFMLFMLMPLIYVSTTAFKPIDELVKWPPQFLVKRPTLNNFSDLVFALSGSSVPFLRYVFNSAVVTIATVVLTIVISCMAAFALSKYPIPYSNVIFSVIIAALMFSSHVTQIPTFFIVDALGIMDTYLALIIPKVGAAFNVFLVKQFADQLPDPLIEAARIDGASEWTVFWRIAMPFLKPAWSALLVFSFISSWNDFFSPLIYISRETFKTLPVILQSIAGGVATVSISRAGAVAATTFLMTAPTVILFTMTQRKVIETMAHSGIK